jgi:ABC-2 type transport system permease protein
MTSPATAPAATPSTEAGPMAKAVAIARRDCAIQFSYQFALIGRVGGIAVTIGTFFFIGKIVDPSKLGEYGDDYFTFVLVGLFVTAIASVGLGSFTDTIRQEQASGTLEILLATPTTLRTLFVGSMLTPFGFATIETSLVTAAAVVVGAHFDPNGVVTAGLALPPTLAVYGAFGAMSAAFIILSKRGDPVTPLLTQLTNLLAGALFPVAVLPEGLQKLAHLLPSYYALVVMRAGLLDGEPISAVAGEFAILVMFAVVLLPLSLWMLRRAIRTARVLGTIGSY